MTVDLEFNYNEITSTMDIFSEGDMKVLRSWIQTLDRTKPVPKDLSDKQIVLFYNACYGDMEKTKACVESYYNYRRNYPEYFSYRVFKSEELRAASNMVEMFILPGKSCEGYQTLFTRLHDTDPAKYDVDSLFKLFVMTVDQCLTTRGPQPGCICICDMQGFQLGHLTKLNPFTIRKIVQYLQEALPVRIKCLHIINTEPIIDKMLAFIKPFVDKNLFDMIKTYNKNEVAEKLYEIVPRSSLPKEYGGTLPDTQTLHKQFTQQLQNLEPYFRAEEEQRLAALPDTTGEDTMQGSFKKLNID